MIIRQAMPIASLLSLLSLANTGFCAEDTTDETNPPAPYNSVVVETDHGQGLGPGGTDLHFGNSGLDPANDDAELFLKALDEPLPVNQQRLNADANSSANGELEPEDVVAAEHPVVEQ